MVVEEPDNQITNSKFAPSKPCVSIGVPVYNEERFLLESLRSLLAQDYEKLEIIISDNASTDDTEQICRGIALEDRRVVYHRFDENRGITENFRSVLELATGRYFMWASGHDLWSTNLVSECVNILEQKPSVVIAFGSSNWIDAEGRSLPRFSGWTDTRGMDTIGRFYTVFWGNMHPILGVIRSEALHKTRILSAAGSDLIILSELALQGDFAHATTASWSRRDFRGIENYKQRMKRYQSQDVGLSISFFEKLFPLIRLPLELIRSTVLSEISLLEKLCILLTLLPSVPVKYIITRKMQG